MSLKESFAENLKRIRKSRGITQEELAELVDVAPRHISFIETARSFPSCELLERLSKVLNVKYSTLFAFHDDFTDEELLERIAELVKGADSKKLRYLYTVISEL